MVWQNEGVFGGGFGRFGLVVWVDLGKVVLLTMGELGLGLVVWVD